MDTAGWDNADSGERARPELISPTFLISCPIDECTWNMFARNWREGLDVIRKWDTHMEDDHPGVM